MNRAVRLWRMKKQKKKEETQRLINEIYAENPDIQAFMEKKDKYMQRLFYFGLTVHLLWYIAAAYGAEGLFINLPLCFCLLLLLSCHIYAKPIRRGLFDVNSQVKTFFAGLRLFSFYVVFTFLTGFVCGVMGDIFNPPFVAILIITLVTQWILMVFTSGRVGSWGLLNLCREMSLPEWMFMFLSLLTLAFYLLFFVINIRLLRRKNRSMVKRFLELQEIRKKKEKNNGIYIKDQSQGASCP